MKDLTSIKTQVTQPAFFFEMVEELSGWAKKLQDQVIEIPCSIEPGFQVNAGQQFKVIATLRHNGYSKTLITVYIKASEPSARVLCQGCPSNANTSEDLANILYGEVMDNQNFIDVLRALVSLKED